MKLLRLKKISDDRNGEMYPIQFSGWINLSRPNQKKTKPNPKIRKMLGLILYLLFIYN